MRISIKRTDSIRTERQKKVETQSEMPPKAGLNACDDTLDVSGVRIKGLKLESVKSANIKMSTQLNSGTFLFPGLYGKVDAEVPDSCSAWLTLDVKRDEFGVVRIKEVDVELSETITVSNLGSAFLKKNKGYLRMAAAALVDQFATVEVTRIHINEDGSVEFDGYVKGPFSIRTPLTKVAGAILPLFDLNVRNLLSRMEPQKEHLSLGVGMLQTLGQMVSEANYEADLQTSPTNLVIDHSQLHVNAEGQPARAHLKGIVTLNEHLDLCVTAESKHSFIESLLGHVVVAGRLNVSHPLDEFAHIEIAAAAQASALPELEINGHHVQATTARIEVGYGADVFVKEDVGARNGKGFIACQVDKLNIRKDASLQLEAINGRLNIHNLEMSRATRSISFNGDLAIGIYEASRGPVLTKAPVSLNDAKSALASLAPLRLVADKVKAMLNAGV